MPITRLLNANSAPVASEPVLRDCTKARGSMTADARNDDPAAGAEIRLTRTQPRGHHERRLGMFVFQALTHSRRSMDTSRQRPRRTSSHEMAMTIPVLSSGMPCCNAYETANALPSRASRPFSEHGCSWIPLWSTPLFRPLVSSPTLHVVRAQRCGAVCPRADAPTLWRWRTLRPLLPQCKHHTYSSGRVLGSRHKSSER